jgi:hypothetical protein
MFTHMTPDQLKKLQNEAAEAPASLGQRSNGSHVAMQVPRTKGTRETGGFIQQKSMIHIA